MDKEKPALEWVSLGPGTQQRHMAAGDLIFFSFWFLEQL
jgi:hypothetical protein